MAIKVVKIDSTRWRHGLPKYFQRVLEGRRYLVTKHRSPVAGFVAPADLRCLRELSKIRPELVSELFQFASHKERVAVGEVLRWLDMVRRDNNYEEG